MNKLLKYFIFLLILISSFSLISCKKEEAIEKSFPEIVQELNSYKLVGRL